MARNVTSIKEVKMLRRDFNKPVKDYINKNKIWLIALVAILLVGLVVGIVLGFDTNYEISGYNEFSISINSDQRNKFNSYANSVEGLVNGFGGECDTISLYGEGDNSKIIVRYTNSLSANNVAELNNDIADELNISIDLISQHEKVAPQVKNTDYVYTVSAVLILIVIASLFAYFRYNGASAVCIILACIFGTAGFLAISSILRITIGLSYFAMIVLLNMMIIYFAIDIFERMRSGSYLGTGDYASAIDEAMKSSRFKMCVISIAILLIGLLFVITAPTAIKFLSLSIMFLAVVLLAVVCYIIPFIWNILIPHCKRAYKVKSTVKEDNNA